MSRSAPLHALLATAAALALACEPPATAPALTARTHRALANTPPVLAAIGARAGAEAQLLAFAVSATDVDGDALTWTASPLPTGSSFAGQEFRWTPDFSQAGTWDVTFTVSDGAAQDAETVRLSISNTNRPPQLTPTPDKTVAEGGTVSIVLFASDADPDALTYQADPLTLPAGASFDPSARTFTWTPSYTQAGNYTVTFSVTDGAATVADDVAIQVNNTNRPPTLGALQPRTVTEGAALSVTFAGSDPDGDPLTYAVVPLPPGAALDASAGTFHWTPGYTQSGGWPMTVTVTDGTATASTSFSVAVSNTNRPPVLAGTGPAQVDEGTEWVLALNATDPDGTAVVVSCTGLPAGAVLETFASLVRWTPGFTQAGPYGFTCSATDGTLATQASFSVTVTQVNQPPTWPTAPPPLLREGTAESVPLAASDPDGDTLAYAAAGLPPGASYHAQTGLLTWTPGYTQAGTWPLTLSASDGQASSQRTVTLVVADTNLPPAVDALAPETVREGDLLVVTASGTDGDGDTLTWSAAPLPVGASFEPATRTFRWMPDFGQAGTYTVTFEAEDEALSDTAPLAITVTAGNRPPELYVPGPRTLLEAELVTFTVSGMDPEGMPLTFGAGELPEGATFTPATRTFSWIPSYAQAGRWTVTLTVSDGDHTTEAQVELTVGDVNRGPVLAPLRAPEVVVGRPVSLAFKAEDPEGEAVTYAAEGLPEGATLDATTGKFDWVPRAAQVGQVVMRVRASDPAGRGSELGLTFQVKGASPFGCTSAPSGAWPLALPLMVLAAGRRRRRG